MCDGGRDPAHLLDSGASHCPQVTGVADISELQAAIEGEVLTPGTAGYDDARRPAMARFADVRPQAVVRCASPADVAAALAFARRAQLPVVPRSGGHCFAGRSTTEGVVIDVRPMAGVEIGAGVAVAGAGARLGEVLDALDAHGVCLATGCGPEVGIAGLALGGGIGILGRLHGLTSDSLRAARVVLADGRITDCDEKREPDLLWALQGGGLGTPGVVTSLRFATRPARDATAFHVTWPVERAAALIEAWQAWAPGAPDEIAAQLLVTVPPEPERPAVVTVFGAMTGSEAATAAQLGDLAARARAEPATSVMCTRTLRETKRWLSSLDDTDEPAEDGHMYSRCEFFRHAIPGEAIAEVVEHLTHHRVAGEARGLDFAPLGGAYARLAPEATAFPHRDARFLLKHEVVVPAAMPSNEREPARRWLARSWGIVRPWGTGGVYANFPDPDLADEQAAYYGPNLERLLEVRARYDPDGVFTTAR